MGSDCGLESPGGDGGDGGSETAEESRGCPFAALHSSHRAALWNGRSPADRGPAWPAGDEQQGAAVPHKRVTRRRRVNLDSLGESLRRLTSPMVGLHAVSVPRTDAVRWRVVAVKL